MPLLRRLRLAVAAMLLAWAMLFAWSVPAALASAMSEQDLVGLWYGEGYQPTWDTEAEWLVERFPDGTFRAEYRILRGCQIEHEQVETGIWWVIGDEFMTLTETIDGTRAYPPPHTYRITRRDGDQIEYTYVERNVAFKARRVKERLSRPACLS